MFALICVVLANDAGAQTWTGGGTDNLWTNGANWGGIAPANDGTAAVAFGATTRLTPDMNANWSILSLAFNNAAGAFTLGSTGGFTLTIQGGGITNNSTNTETINQAITLGTFQTWNASSGNLMFGGAINNNNQTLTIDGADNTTITGVINGTGGLTKNGAGTLTLSGSNNFTNATMINAGVVNVQNNTAFGASNQNVSVASGAAIQLQNGVSVANNLTISGSGISNDGALRNISGINLLTGNIALNANSYIGVDAGTLILSGQIGGGGFGLTLVGNGTVVFAGTGDNSYNGTTEVKSGTLLLSKTAGHQAIAGPLLIDTGAVVHYTAANQMPNVPVTLNGTGQLDLNGFNETNCNGLTFTGGSVMTGVGVLTLGAGGATITSNASSLTATISGNLDLGGTDRTFTVASGTTAAGVDLAISANISGNRNITKAGAGFLDFAGANTYTGSTTINAGTLEFSKEVSLYNNNTANWTTANLIVASGATAAFNVGGTGEFTSSDIDILKALGTNSGGFESGSFLGFDTSNASGGTFSYSSNIANPNAGSNVLGLTKLGSGALVLSGTNSYTGATTVKAGSLFVNNTSGSGTGIGTVTVNSGATLGGNGTISGAVAVGSGGTLSPGAMGAGSTAVLHTGALSFSSGANFTLDLNNTTVGSGYDQVSVTGTVNITGSNLVLNLGAGLSLGDKFYIVANDGTDSIIGTFSQGTTITVGNDTFLINYADNFDGGSVANDISLTLTAIVPEPSTWIAAIVPFAAIVWHHRLLRRRRYAS
jgi:fibronectin-binding autotransporter adhesin